MARIAPPACPIESATLSPWHPGQSVLQHAYSGATTVVSRGVSGWRGSFTFSPYGATADARAKSLAAWLWNMRGGENTSNLELPQHFQPRGAPASTFCTVTSLTRGATTASLVYNLFDAGSWRPQVGDFVTANFRLLCVQSVASSGSTYTLQVTPNITVPTTAPLFCEILKPYLHCRVIGNPVLNRRGEQYGTTQVQVQEVI